MKRAVLLVGQLQTNCYVLESKSDIDLYMSKSTNPSSIKNVDGATLNSPEETSLVDNGRFFILVVGFDVNPPSSAQSFTIQIHAIEDFP